MNLTPSSFQNAWLRGLRDLSLALGLIALGGCAGYQAFREGQAALTGGQAEQGLTSLRRAMELEPTNLDYRRAFFAQREALVNAMVREAEQSVELGAFDIARLAFAKASALDPQSHRVIDGLSRLDLAQRHWKSLETALALSRDGKIESAIAMTQMVLSENPHYRRATMQLRQLMRVQSDHSGKDLGLYPKLRAAYRVPVSLSFTNATLLQVFEALKLASGLNYMIERDVRPDLRVTISVTSKPVEDIVRLLLATNQLERRVLDDDTLLIYPNTQAKAAEYKEMVVRAFYLNNAEASKVANVLRTIAKARDVVVDDKLNMLVVRDSAEVIRLSEKLIASQDLPEPEVMLELEVLEVSVSRLLELGIRWPDSVAASIVGTDGVNGQLRLNELRNRSSNMVKLQIGDPLVSAQLRSTKGDATLLANPRVRVKSKHSAKILVGERVPVITTTFTANVGTSNSVSYLDVGLKLDIEPTVSLDDEVSMKVALEVSNVIGTTTTSGGTRAYTLGTRNTSTSLRVRDGETNILAGLIQRDERRSNTGVPGLNEVPVVSKLFGSAQDSDTRTEIVLLITPRIVRNLDIPGVGIQEFLAGTDASVGASPIQLGRPSQGARQALEQALPGMNPQPGAPGQRSPIPRATDQLPAPSALLPGPAAPALTVPPLVPTTPR